MRTKGISSFGEGKLSTYIIGYVVSIVLTVIPFFLVMRHASIRSIVALTIVVFAVAQISVHIVCFLRLRPSSDQTWNWLAFIYTLILLLALVGGTSWIIFSLNNNMMMG